MYEYVFDINNVGTLISAVMISTRYTGFVYML